MWRYLARGLLAVVTVWLAGPACAQQPVPKPVPVAAPPSVPVPPAAVPAPVRTAPTRPNPIPAPSVKLWPVTRLRNFDYVSVRDLAARFDLKATWTKSETTMTLSDAHSVRLTFDSNQRDFYFDGLRVFMGEPVLLARDTLWVSLIDVIKVVAPLFRPVDHLTQLPATAPRLIVIDPGHGGSDPGKENKLLGVNEKTFTLDVALRLKKILEARNWKVLLTRTEDRELSPVKKKDLQMRDDFANSNKADLFLSIHFNSVERDPDRVTGVETFTMTPQFMLSTGSEKKDELTDVAFPGNKFDYANLLFGAQVHRAILAELKVPDRGFKRQRWAVLRFLDCPGLLVECGYLSNPTEARRISGPEYRQKIAEGIAAGVLGYADTLAALRPAPAPATK